MKRLLSMIMLFLISTAVTARADRGANEIASLKGIHTVSVVVMITDETHGLTETTLSALVELELRSHGLRVLTATDEENADASVNIVIQSINVGTDYIAYTTFLNVLQVVDVRRNKVPLITETWSYKRIACFFTSEFASTVKENINESLLILINDIQSAND